MAMRYADPFDALFTIQRALENRLTSRWMDSGTGGSGSYPPINIFQQGDTLIAVIELPGVEKSDLSIEAKDNTIRIAGQKKVPFPEGVSAHRRERLWGVFDRTLSLPMQIEAEGIQAAYQDGLLTLHIPRAERDRPRTIQIR